MGQQNSRSQKCQNGLAEFRDRLFDFYTSGGPAFMHRNSQIRSGRDPEFREQKVQEWVNDHIDWNKGILKDIALEERRWRNEQRRWEHIKKIWTQVNKRNEILEKFKNQDCRSRPLQDIVIKSADLDKNIGYFWPLIYNDRNAMGMDRLTFIPGEPPSYEGANSSSRLGEGTRRGNSAIVPRPATAPDAAPGPARGPDAAPRPATAPDAAPGPGPARGPDAAPRPATASNAAPDPALRPATAPDAAPDPAPPPVSAKAPARPRLRPAPPRRVPPERSTIRPRPRSRPPSRPPFRLGQPPSTPLKIGSATARAPRSDSPYSHAHEPRR